jgi:hypothetical protein
MKKEITPGQIELAKMGRLDPFNVVRLVILDSFYKNKGGRGLVTEEELKDIIRAIPPISAILYNDYVRRLKPVLDINYQNIFKLARSYEINYLNLEQLIYSYRAMITEGYYYRFINVLDKKRGECLRDDKEVLKFFDYHLDIMKTAHKIRGADKMEGCEELQSVRDEYKRQRIKELNRERSLIWKSFSGYERILKSADKVLNIDVYHKAYLEARNQIEKFDSMTETHVRGTLVYIELITGGLDPLLKFTKEQPTDYGFLKECILNKVEPATGGSFDAVNNFIMGFNLKSRRGRKPKEAKA